MVPQLDESCFCHCYHRNGQQQAQHSENGASNDHRKNDRGGMKSDLFAQDVRGKK